MEDEQFATLVRAGEIRPKAEFLYGGEEWRTVDNLAMFHRFCGRDVPVGAHLRKMLVDRFEAKSTTEAFFRLVEDYRQPQFIEQRFSPDGRWPIFGEHCPLCGSQNIRMAYGIDIN